MFDTATVTNMQQFLAELESRSGSQPLIRHMDGKEVRELSASEFFELTHRCASLLASHDLSGKHIGIMGRNTVSWLSYFCAIFQIGAVAVLLSPELNPEELNARISLADVDFILFDEDLKDRIPQTLPGICLNVPENVTAVPLPRSQAGADELACILFTSGTTAAGKAVMLSHRSMISGSCHNVVDHGFDAQLAILPMHHVAGFATVLNTWYLGATVCLGQDVKYLYRYLEHLKPDYVLTVPSILQAIVRRLRRSGPNGKDLGWNLQLIGCGGAAFPSEVIRSLNDRNIRVLQSYGATEAGGIGFDWEMTPACSGTIGRPCPEIETKIVDGELFLRSPSVMMGYYKDPEGTRAVLHDGWYATGDLCRQDEQGFLYLTGRKKNLIIRPNGENVSPEEIEHRLLLCHAISEIMVGLENDLITATVFPADFRSETEKIIQDAITEYNQSVPLCKQIQNLHFSDVPFAKTEVGKMIRRSVTGGVSE